MQIKATARSHFTAVRMSIIWKFKNKRKQTKAMNSENARGKGTLIHHWWDGKLVQPLWKTVWRFLTYSKIDLPWWPRYCTPAAWNEIIIWESYLYTHISNNSVLIRYSFTSNFYHQMISKMFSIYTMQYCPCLRKNELLPLAGKCIPLYTIMLSKVRQSQRDLGFSLICGS